MLATLRFIYDDQLSFRFETNQTSFGKHFRPGQVLDLHSDRLFDLDACSKKYSYRSTKKITLWGPECFQSMPRLCL